MRCWRKMAGSGGASMAVTVNRHDAGPLPTSQMFGGDFGCRWHAGDEWQNPDPANAGCRGGTAIKRNYFFDYQQPPAARITDADCVTWHRCTGCRLQWCAADDCGSSSHLRSSSRVGRRSPHHGHARCASSGRLDIQRSRLVAAPSRWALCRIGRTDGGLWADNRRRFRAGSRCRSKDCRCQRGFRVSRAVRARVHCRAW